jgi:hypothetical protein
MFLDIGDVNHIIALLAFTYVPVAVSEMDINLLLGKWLTTVFTILNILHVNI